MSQTVVLNMPLFVDSDTVALVFDPEPEFPKPTGLDVYDECGNLETAIQYSHDGYICVAVNPEFWHYATNSDKPELRFTVEQIQEALDHEAALVADCFGRRTYSWC